MGKIKKGFNSFLKKTKVVRRKIKKATLITLGTYALVQTPLTIMRNSSGEKGSFKQKYYERFDIRLVGYNDEIEEDLFLQSRLISVTKKRIYHGLKLPPRINIESDTFFRKNPMQQIETLLSSGLKGYANPFTYSVTIKKGVMEDSIMHEMVHIDTYRQMWKDPYFLFEWYNLSRDKNGESEYLGIVPTVFNGCRGLEDLTEDIHMKREEVREEGFARKYGMTNVFEDIATFGEEIYSDTKSDNFLDIIWAEENGPLLKKLKLAIKYGFIDKDYIVNNGIEL